jgi:hypothetical protein
MKEILKAARNEQLDTVITATATDPDSK